MVSTFTKHNNYELLAEAAAMWGTPMNANIILIERGVTIKGIAGTTILKNEVVYLDSNFKFDLAMAGGGVDSDKWVGFATSDINIDGLGYALHAGYVIGGDWNFTSGPVYLSDSIAGAVTQTEPANNIVAGFAIQTNEILIKPWAEKASTTTDSGEGHVTIFGPTKTWNSTIGTWTRINNSSQICRYFMYNTFSGNLEALKYKIFLSSEGEYNIKIHSLKNTSSGFGEVLVDDVPVGSTFDMYASPAEWNVITTVTGLTVQASGIKEVTFRVNGRNASSSAYRFYLSTAVIYRIS